MPKQKIDAEHVYPSRQLSGIVCLHLSILDNVCTHTQLRLAFPLITDLAPRSTLQQASTSMCTASSRRPLSDCLTVILQIQHHVNTPQATLLQQGEYVLCGAPHDGLHADGIGCSRLIVRPVISPTPSRQASVQIDRSSWRTCEPAQICSSRGSVWSVFTTRSSTSDSEDSMLCCAASKSTTSHGVDVMMLLLHSTLVA